MTPQRFRELQKEADYQGSGQCSIRGDELEELLNNTITLMGIYAKEAKQTNSPPNANSPTSAPNATGAEPVH